MLRTAYFSTTTVPNFQRPDAEQVRVWEDLKEKIDDWLFPFLADRINQGTGRVTPEDLKPDGKFHHRLTIIEPPNKWRHFTFDGKPILAIAPQEFEMITTRYVGGRNQHSLVLPYVESPKTKEDASN